jgi:hypothetical protein
MANSITKGSFPEEGKMNQQLSSRHYKKSQWRGKDDFLFMSPVDLGLVGLIYTVWLVVFDPASFSFNPEPTATVRATVAVGSGLNEPDRLRRTGYERGKNSSWQAGQEKI